MDYVNLGEGRHRLEMSDLELNLLGHAANLLWAEMDNPAITNVEDSLAQEFDVTPRDILEACEEAIITIPNRVPFEIEGD